MLNNPIGAVQENCEQKYDHTKGREYFVELGKRGGAMTRDRYGTKYLKELAQRGGEADRQKYYIQPRTMLFTPGMVVRNDLSPTGRLDQQSTANDLSIFVSSLSMR